MARIRTIKPEFWGDEKLSLLDPLTRLVYLGLISHADDAGRLVDNVKQLDGMIFPGSDDTCRESLDILAKLSRVCRYVSTSGQQLIQIISWGRHQKVDHPNKYVLPAPTGDDFKQAQSPQGFSSSLSQVTAGIRESIAKSSRDVRATTSTNDQYQRPTTNDRVTRLAPRELTTDEKAVLDHYLMRHPKRRPAEAQARKSIGPALKRYSPDELCKAIDGNADDPWHAERAKHELSYVLRAEKIDGFIEQADKRAAPKEFIRGDDETAVLKAIGMVR